MSFAVVLELGGRGNRDTVSFYQSRRGAVGTSSFAFSFVCFVEVIAGQSCETSPRVRY